MPTNWSKDNRYPTLDGGEVTDTTTLILDGGLVTDNTTYILDGGTPYGFITDWTGRPVITTNLYDLVDIDGNKIVDIQGNQIQVIGDPYEQNTLRTARTPI